MPLPGIVDKALQEALFAYRNTSSYHALLDSAGIDCESLNTDTFQSLPLTDKEYYRANYPSGVIAVRGSLSTDRHILKSTSSGTAGDRLTTVSYTYDLAKRMRNTTSAHPVLRGTLLGIESQRIARFAAPNCSDVECAVPNSTMDSRMLRDGTLVLPVGHDLLATGKDLVDQAIDEIEKYDPHWFYTDATHLAFLVRQYATRGLAFPRVRAVALTYTLATQVARRQIRAAIGPDVPMAEVVSMSELGWVTIECERGSMHLNGTSFHVELLDPRTLEPVPQGGVGELVITSIGDRLLPHIRYRTGDLYRLMPPCPCGHEHLTVRHEGRDTHLLRLPSGGVVSPKRFDDAIGPDENVTAYRILQQTGNRFQFKYIPAGGHPGRHGDELADRVRELLGPGSELTVQAVDYIPSGRSGKFLSCVRDPAVAR